MRPVLGRPGLPQEAQDYNEAFQEFLGYLNQYYEVDPDPELEMFLEELDARYDVEINDPDFVEQKLEREYYRLVQVSHEAWQQLKAEENQPNGPQLYEERMAIKENLKAVREVAGIDSWEDPMNSQALCAPEG